MAWRAPPPAEKVMAGTRPRIQLRPAGGARPPHRHHAPPPAAAPSAPPAPSPALGLLLLQLLLASCLLLPDSPAPVPEIACVESGRSQRRRRPCFRFFILCASPFSPASSLPLKLTRLLRSPSASPAASPSRGAPIPRPFDSQLYPCMFISRFLLLVFGIRGDSIKPEPAREKKLSDS